MSNPPPHSSPHHEAPYPQGPYGGVAPQPPPHHPPPARARTGRGCLIAVLIIVGLMVASVVAFGIGIVWLSNKAEEAIGTVTPCPYVSDAEATEAVGTEAKAELFTGALGRVLNVTDLRVLPDKSSCIIQQNTDSDPESLPGLGRTVLFTGADARALYERELAKAKGVTENRGGGATVETESYFNREVPGLGDRAFCTKTSGTLAGVLALDGDTLVYVAVTRAGSDVGVDLSDPANGRLTTDDPACDASVALAGKILAKN
jgi:hypothetical protein